MNKIYDVDSDQLKCSFCMAYFKCSLHFANLQRYALKACTNCLASFSYSILHPESFRLYRLLLLDVGVALPPNNTTPTLLQQTIDQLNYKVSLHFQQSIEAIMREMEKVRHNLQLTLDKLRQDYSDTFDKTINQDGSSHDNELQNVIEQLRRYEVKHILAEKGWLLGDKKGDMLKSVRKSPFGRLEKENIQSSNYSNVSKLLKSKICGTSSSRLLASSTSNSKLLCQSRERTFSKSRISRSILKSMEASVQGGAQRFGQQDRSEIGRLLEQRPAFVSYMPREVIKQSNVCLKSEGSRNVIQSVLDLRSRTAKTGQVIQLIGGDASRTNFACYLRSLKEMGEDALATVKTVRMIRCQLVDADMDHLLNLVAQMPMVETLIATNNKLTELSVEAATAFKERHPQSRLTNLYLGNNHISGRTLRKEPPSLSIHL